MTLSTRRKRRLWHSLFMCVPSSFFIAAKLSQWKLTWSFFPARTHGWKCVFLLVLWICYSCIKHGKKLQTGDLSRRRKPKSKSLFGQFLVFVLSPPRSLLFPVHVRLMFFHSSIRLDISRTFQVHLEHTTEQMHLSSRNGRFRFSFPIFFFLLCYVVLSCVLEIVNGIQWCCCRICCRPIAFNRETIFIFSFSFASVCLAVVAWHFVLFFEHTSLLNKSFYSECKEKCAAIYHHSWNFVAMK